MAKKHIEHALNNEELANRFKVVIFGSARTKPGEYWYDEVFKLGRLVTEAGFDIVTGGGPGSMEAANLGHKSAPNESKVDSYGINIKLPFEQHINSGVEIAHEHERFSTRLDEFMFLANVVVVTPGGIGTLLELYYTWQLIQIHHMSHMPIILVGEMWEGLIKWMKDSPLKMGMFNEDDLHTVYLAEDVDEAFGVIQAWHETFIRLKDSDLDYHKYDIGKLKAYKVLFNKNKK